MAEPLVLGPELTATDILARRRGDFSDLYDTPAYRDAISSFTVRVDHPDLDSDPEVRKWCKTVEKIIRKELLSKLKDAA